MANFIKVDITFSFDINDNNKSKLKTSHYFESKEEIPCSTWEVSCERIENAEKEKCRINVDLKQFSTFKKANIVGAGKASLTWDFGDSSNFITSFKTSQVCQDFDLAATQLNNLTSERVWSVESDDLIRPRLCSTACTEPISKYTVVINILLFCNKSKMQCKVSELLKNGMYSDVVLVAEGREFKAHKWILCVASEVFQRMFEAEMKEKIEGRVVIEDVKSNVLEKLLMFVYNGVLEDDVIDQEPDFFEDLYTAAEKYSLMDLKKAVAQKMCTGITLENVGRRFLMSDQFSEKALRKKCLEFFKDNLDELAEQNENIFP